MGHNPQVCILFYKDGAKLPLGSFLHHHYLVSSSQGECVRQSCGSHIYMEIWEDCMQPYTILTYGCLHRLVGPPNSPQSLQILLKAPKENIVDVLPYGHDVFLNGVCLCTQASS